LIKVKEISKVRGFESKRLLHEFWPTFLMTPNLNMVLGTGAAQFGIENYPAPAMITPTASAAQAALVKQV
jgi:hypothetical protein